MARTAFRLQLLAGVGVYYWTAMAFCADNFPELKAAGREFFPVPLHERKSA
jgi:hypothetical protein